MDPLDPGDAQQIVIEYARKLERDISENRHPARVDSLPFAKPIIKSAIRTSTRHLSAMGLMTEEMREFLATAYIGLADYLDGELVELVTMYRQSGEQLTAEAQSVHDRTQTAAWRTLVESGSLAGELARATASDAAALREEFESFL